VFCIPIGGRAKPLIGPPVGLHRLSHRGVLASNGIATAVFGHGGELANRRRIPQQGSAVPTYNWPWHSAVMTAIIAVMISSVVVVIFG